MSLHGGDIWNLAASHGLSPDRVLDFSSSLNPLGVPESVRRLLADQFDLARPYPDPEYRELRSGLAAWLGLAADQMAVGNGASELIREILMVLKPRRVLVPMPGFAEYGRAARALGIEVFHHYTDAAAGFRLDPEALDRQIKRDQPDLVFICNPNNPTAVQLDRPTMEAIAGVVQAAGAWLVVDETFIELSRLGNAASLAPLLCGLTTGVHQLQSPGERLIVLRALTKTFALAGLRLGYLAAPAETAGRIRDSLVPWSVNGFAARLGGIFGEEAAYLERTAAWMAEEPDWLHGRLIELARPGLGLGPGPGGMGAAGNRLLATVLRPDSNFILCQLRDGLTAAKLRETLLVQGILIRNCGNFPGLGPQWFRVAVRSRADNERLMAAVRSLGVHESRQL